MKKMKIQNKICYYKGRKYEREKIKHILWTYYRYSDLLTEYFGKNIEYNNWRQVYADYIFAKQYLIKNKLI